MSPNFLILNLIDLLSDTLCCTPLLCISFYNLYIHLYIIVYYRRETLKRFYVTKIRKISFTTSKFHKNVNLIKFEHLLLWELLHNVV